MLAFSTIFSNARRMTFHKDRFSECTETQFDDSRWMQVRSAMLCIQVPLATSRCAQPRCWLTREMLIAQSMATSIKSAQTSARRKACSKLHHNS
eukprot:3931094-Amphidinium_carterae.1